ncbi:hypothetical protein OPT61_g368 [Boeremia exigua]|uniref:Uncharacterized protein n=1 Tax=Boeremia exigua TaxID=749465 RepID=A0ACC2IU07_9PLEO|nr:hypothetical protein OPT61_g368 [Boeremia exigua]
MTPTFSEKIKIDDDDDENNELRNALAESDYAKYRNLSIVKLKASVEQEWHQELKRKQWEIAYLNPYWGNETLLVESDLQLWVAFHDLSVRGDDCIHFRVIVPQAPDESFARIPINIREIQELGPNPSIVACTPGGQWSSNTTNDVQLQRFVKASQTPNTDSITLALFGENQEIEGAKKKRPQDEDDQSKDTTKEPLPKRKTKRLRNASRNKGRSS